MSYWFIWSLWKYSQTQNVTSTEFSTKVSGVTVLALFRQIGVIKWSKLIFMWWLCDLIQQISEHHSQIGWMSYMRSVKWAVSISNENFENYSKMYMVASDNHMFGHYHPISYFSTISYPIYTSYFIHLFSDSGVISSSFPLLASLSYGILIYNIYNVRIFSLNDITIVFWMKRNAFQLHLLFIRLKILYCSNESIRLWSR